MLQRQNGVRTALDRGLRCRSSAISYFRRMLRNIRSFEPSSAGLSEAGVVGGVDAEFRDTVELAVEGTGDARMSVEPDDAEAMAE